MKSILMGIALMGLAAAQTFAQGPTVVSEPVRDRALFDFEWRFHAGEVESGQNPALDASDWEAVALPHDFMIEGRGQVIEVPGRRGGRRGRGGRGGAVEPEGPFDPRSPGGSSNGYLNGGIGWYRKAFTMPESARGRHSAIEFEGVYMNAEVWINGQSLGVRPYGYSGFEYDLSPHLKYGNEPNVLAVRVYVPQPSTRWYSGAGIYRHVWLTTTDPIHIDHWGVQLSVSLFSAAGGARGADGRGGARRGAGRRGGDGGEAASEGAPAPAEAAQDAQVQSRGGLDATARGARGQRGQPGQARRGGGGRGGRGAYAHLDVVTNVKFETAFDGPLNLETVVRDRDGNVVVWGWGRPNGQRSEEVSAAAGEVVRFEQTLLVRGLQRWSLDNPYLYSVESILKKGGMVSGAPIDHVVTPYGFRSIEFTEEQGFLLNGVRTPIYGVCNHHDLGPLGAAAFDRAIERQLEVMKQMGVNAIRTSHNPPAPALLDLCDRMGLLVMDEAFDEWRENKTTFGYGQFYDQWAERDIKDMVRRDRNHPSVFMWSIGNEINEQRNADVATTMATQLADWVREEDSTRPVTSGMNNILRALETGFAAPLDLLGVNYNVPNYPRLVGRGKPIYASETSSNYSSRDEYNLVIDDAGKVQILHHVYGQQAPVGADGRPIQHCTSYDLDFPRWGNTAEVEFLGLRGTSQVAGEFVWTGFDYIGEPTPFGWPNRSSSFGIVDICGFPKDRFYLYQSQWKTEPMVHILPHWIWPDEFVGKEIPVWAYTNADEVELFLNDRSLGTRAWADTTGTTHLAWQVPYERGTLRAVAKKGGEVVAADEVQTFGAPARIELSVDRPTLDADGQDLAFVTARVLDAQGRLVRTADPSIRFALTGTGAGSPAGAKIAGIDNGDPTNHEPFIGPTPAAHSHLAFNGLCLAVVRAGHTAGPLSLTALVEGLPVASAQITVK